MVEVYGVVPKDCPKCKTPYEPGIGYGFLDRREPWDRRSCALGNVHLVPDKCMKCPTCGDSRFMTGDEYLDHKNKYKRINP